MSDKPCKLFQGYRDADGYGRVRHLGDSRLAHRVAYAEHHGIPLGQLNGVTIRHKCDTPACIEPEHLEAGTQADNMRDVAARERSGQLKLSIKEVEWVREHYRKGHKEFGQRALARRFGVSQAAIYYIVHNINRSLNVG